MDAPQRGPEISRRGRVPTWVVLSLGATALFFCVEVIGERLYAEGHFEVELDRVQIEAAEEGVYIPSGWSEFVAAHISSFDRVFADDAEAVSRVAAELETLPLFRSVGDVRVIVPDGIEVEVRMRRVVACVKTGGGFLPVSEDGFILPGFSVSPMNDGVGDAPLIAWDESLGYLRVGDELSDPRHYDGLSVALSMQRHLPSELRASLGSIRIDASGAELASVTDPGVVLYLPERRAVLFGRPPLQGRSGELPEELKWGHLAEHLSLSPDWEVLDIRWDEADVLRWRE